LGKLCSHCVSFDSNRRNNRRACKEARVFYTVLCCFWPKYPLIGRKIQRFSLIPRKGNPIHRKKRAFRRFDFQTARRPEQAGLMVRDAAFYLAPFAEGLAWARPARMPAAPHREGSASARHT